MMSEKRRSDCVGLPTGWKREEVVRKSGLSAGKTDVYYFSPDGKKIRSKPQLSRYLGELLDLSAFDFRSGKTIHSALRKSKRHRGTVYDHARGICHDTTLALPIRQTASIFKQPVTVVRTRPEGKTKSDLKQGSQENQPRQLFWEKRLQGLRASDNTGESLLSLQLPKSIHGIGPELTPDSVLQSISAALHLNSQPVTGQNASKSSINKNPGVHIDANQPHIQATVVSEEDVRQQERLVTDARKRLQDAIKGFA
ncbi:methyl-CpG-binding domain protein 2-like isoform X2 [Liolophura sinensis]|uniref:methyl-CpG-binding domain protein 2-like isoform X2 n=1 Tax=Liolophura sinensis TaxID=3198878 RepID=UPI003158888B